MPGCCIQRWSISLGRWWGVTVHLHFFFLLFSVLAFAFAWPDPDMLAAGGMVVCVLLMSLLLHELAHSLAAIRVGGKVDAIVIGPVGGLVSPRVPDEPETHLFVALAGPLVHLALVVAAAIVLAAEGSAHVLGLLNPVMPLGLVDGNNWLVAAKLTLWLNWVLMLLNLVPAYPFDGGPIMRAMLWPAVERRTARVVTSRVAMTLAAGLCLAALLTFGSDLVTRVPLWIPLATLGLFLFFSAQQDLTIGDPHELANETAGYNVNSDGLDLLDAVWLADEEDEGVLVEHLPPRQQESNRRDQEAFEDARVDDILARLHQSSIDALSPEEVDVLQRASQRYKQRRRPSDQT